MLLLCEADPFRVPCYAVSFQGLLNALDGVAAQEGRLVFMVYAPTTTPHVHPLAHPLALPPSYV